MKNLSNLKVLNNNILVNAKDATMTTDSGLVQSAQYEDKSFCGEVVSAGLDTDIPVGATVYFNKYSSTVFPYGDEEYLMLKEEDIIAYEV